MRHTIAWDDLTDVEIVSSLRAQLDPTGFEVLYRRHADGATSLARRIADSGHADDLVSTAFTRVLAMIRDGKGPDRNVGAYVNATIRTAHIDHIRREIRHRALLEAERQQTIVDTTVSEPDPDADDREDALRTAFATMPERWQRVLWWSEVDDRSPAWIGEQLGLTPNAVAALAFRARRGLRAAYLEQASTADLRV